MTALGCPNPLQGIRRPGLKTKKYFVNKNQGTLVSDATFCSAQGKEPQGSLFPFGHRRDPLAGFGARATVFLQEHKRLAMWYRSVRQEGLSWRVAEIVEAVENSGGSQRDHIVLAVVHRKSFPICCCATQTDWHSGNM